METTPFTWETSADWDAFCKDNSLAWFWHTSFRLKHALNCSFSVESLNASFLLKENGDIIAIVPLTIDTFFDGPERKKKVCVEMSYGGMKTPIPVVADHIKESRRDKLYQFIFDKIDAIAKTHRVERLTMRQPMTLSHCKTGVYYNYLARYGFSDLSVQTAVVDLAPSEENLFRGMSSNHKRAVKKGLSNLDIRLWDETSITSDCFAAFKSFYFRIAGKVTRPQITFELLYTYLSSGMAVMGEAMYEGVPVGYVVTVIFEKDSYYLMGANEKEFGVCPIAHAIHWEIMKYLKRKGVSHYETGIQQFCPGLMDPAGEKDISISRFKRGFGGESFLSLPEKKFIIRVHLTDSGTSESLDGPDLHLKGNKL